MKFRTSLGSDALGALTSQGAQSPFFLFQVAPKKGARPVSGIRAKKNLSKPNDMEWTNNDGGRKEAGFKGSTGDCACRALAIATDMSYQEAYDLINESAKKERPGSKSRGGKRSSARTGVFMPTMKRIMEDLGWTWVPTMEIGSGCQVHLRSDELPSGTIICRVSRHFCAVVDGVLQDTHDSSRGGSRCVYGYWKKD